MPQWKNIFVHFKLNLHIQLKFYSFLRFIYSFILVFVVCFFAMRVYLISVRFGFHLFFNSNFLSFDFFKQTCYLKIWILYILGKEAVCDSGVHAFH